MTGQNLRATQTALASQPNQGGSGPELLAEARGYSPSFLVPRPMTSILLGTRLRAPQPEQFYYTLVLCRYQQLVQV